MNRILKVWLHGDELAELERLRNSGLRLRYTNETIDRYGIGSCPMSLSLPITTKRIESAELESYLDGLLPEDPLRTALANKDSIRSTDTFALLQVLGSECAGAIQFTEPDKAPPTGFLRTLAEPEVNRIVQDLPTLRTPDNLPITASLGGIQAKVLLTRTERGWAWPANGALSTHIIKPTPSTNLNTVPYLIEAEEWALRLANASGIKAATAWIESFGERKAIVVKRYDRSDGKRLHQEDFTQALGLKPNQKYEITPNSRLKKVARLAAPHALNPQRLQLDLLRAVTFNTAIGNGDAHSKNYAFTITDSGYYSLAPLYDAAPVLLMNRDFHSAGHAVADQTNLNYITFSHLLEEATSWGLNSKLAAETIRTTTEQIAESAPATDIIDVLANVPSMVAKRCHELLDQTVH